MTDHCQSDNRQFINHTCNGVSVLSFLQTSCAHYLNTGIDVKVTMACLGGRCGGGGYRISTLSLSLIFYVTIKFIQ